MAMRPQVPEEFEAFVFGRPRAASFSWADIRPILDAERLQDKIFRRASRITIDDPESFYRRRKTAVARADSVAETAKNTLLAYVQAFPDFDALHPFYLELCSTLIDVPRARRDLRSLSWCAERTSDVCKKTAKQMRRTTRVDFLEKKRKELYGRVGSLIQEVNAPLVRLEKARKLLRDIPSIDIDMPIVVVAGMPNVGKSALVTRICSAKPKVAPYPFTTQGIITGHATLSGLRVQVVDTPGILYRPPDKRNEIEQRALAAVRHLGDVVIFLFDPSPEAVAPMGEQEKLLAEVRELFSKRLALEVENKVDAVRLDTPRLKISALTGDGVDALVAHVVRLLPGRRGRPRWAEEE